MWKKGIKTLGYILFLIASVTLLLEASYRWYIVDFYRNNLNGLNSTALLEATDRPTVLVIGDSFSADQNSYVQLLRDSLSDYRVINAAIPGTCIRQHELFLRSRIQEFQPALLIYQVYVGNDLLEFRHPTGSAAISPARRVYWWLADRLLVLAYINSRLPQLKHWLANDRPQKSDAKLENDFAPERYSGRTKMLIRAAPDFLEKAILLQQQQLSDMEAYTKSLQAAFQNVPNDCPIYLLLMPHAIQVSRIYQNRFLQMGASIEHSEALLNPFYPFYQYLDKHLPQDQVDIINPLSRLQANEQRFPVYYDNDPHLNPQGQLVVGALLLEQLSFIKEKKKEGR